MKIFYIVWTIWFLSEVIISRIKRSKKNKSELDKGTMNLLWVAIFFGISVAILILFNINIPFAKNLSVAMSGLGIILIGMFIRFIAIFSLGKSFTVDISTQENQVLKTRGLFRFVRHPSYLGGLISFVGLGLSFNNILSFFVLMIPIVSAFLYRIKIEEQVLIDKFGDEYIEYMKNTKKLIPFVF